MTTAKKFTFNEPTLVVDPGSSASNAAFDKTHSVMMGATPSEADSSLPVNIVYKKDHMFGVTTGAFNTT